MLVQSSFYWVLCYAGTIFSANKALAITTACQVYPSEYAYKHDSVTEQESHGANCMRYPNGLQEGVFTEQYTHCQSGGTPLKLINSNLGQGQYQSTDYYVWTAGSDAQLLFIFPTRVSLTTITLHYYSDSVTGLPRLILYAVPDDIDVWDATTTSYLHASISPVRELQGRKNISINVNFNTKKVLLYKFSSSIALAVSGVEFFTCTRAISTASILTTTNDLTTSAKTESSNMITESNIMEKDYQPYQSHDDDNNQLKVDERNKGTVPPNNTIRITAIGVSIVILLILSTILIIIVIALIWSYKRRSAKQKLCTDCSYSTLSRASGPQTRTRSTQENSSELYDQIHLSPSTGQTEYIPKSENINNPFTTPQTDSHPIYSTAGEEIAEHSSTLNATSQETSSQLPLQIAHESTNEQPTYAAIDKSKKKKFKAGEKELPVSSYAGHSSSAQKEKENTTKQDIRSPHTIVNEELYTAVKKKEKVCEPKDEEEAPPIPPHTVEELYAAVQKKPKGRSNADCDHNIPSLTKEEMHVAGEKPLQNTTEDPYTAVMKNPKDGSTENYTETAPPIPPHTVEELYTAVMKTSKNGAEDEEKAPPKFSCTVEMILDKH